MPRAAAPLVPALVALLAAPWPQAWLVVVGSVAAAAVAAVWRHGVAIPDARLVLMTMMLSWLAIGMAFVAETMPLAASLALVAALVVVLTLMLGPGTPAQPSVGPGLIGVVLGSTAVAAGAPVHAYLESVLRARAEDVAAHPERFTPHAWATDHTGE